MKNHLILFLTISLFISCRKPAVPVIEGSPLSATHWGTFDVSGECLDLDVSDTVLVVAANYNGFFVFSIDSKNHGLDTVYHEINMDPTMGDNRAERIVLSKNHGMVFVLDRYDKIWVHKLYGTQYIDNWVEDCYGGAWISTTIDDKDDGIGIFSLVNHSSAQSDTSGTVGDYNQYSTSLVWKNFSDVNPGDVFTNSGIPSCEYTYNFSVLPSEVYFSNGLLSVANGELGVLILKQTPVNICVDEDGQEFPEFVPSGNYDEDRDYCTTPPSPGPWIPEDGLGGEFEPLGGFIPSIYASFDTPGEVKTVFSYENTIFAGLSTSNGCLIQYMGVEGELLSNYLFAEGFSVNGIHYDNDLLALACGHDGVLIYQWDGAGLPIFLGGLTTSYANKIKVQGNRVFVATEDGIDIFEIER